MSFCRSARRFGDPLAADAPDAPLRHRCGAPLPLKAAAVGGAFWLFPPLGIAALALLLGRGRRHPGEPGRPEGLRFRAWRRRGWSSGNAAFDAAQAETLKRMAEDAEAFDDFRRREREARDREVFDRFTAERATAAAPASPAGGTPPEPGPAA